MDSPISRREVLQSGGVLAAGSLAGCGYFEDEPIYTSIDIRSFADEHLEVELRVFEPNPDEGFSEILFFESVELEGVDGGEIDDHLFEDAFESKQAIVELKVSPMLGGRDRFMRQFTYFPNCPRESAEERGHRLDITIHSDIEYRRSCGSPN